jgi:hypothetical protein
MTVREAYESAVGTVDAIQALAIAIGSTEWLDMDTDEFHDIMQGENPISSLVLWGAMRSTQLDIEGLPEREER